MTYEAKVIEISSEGMLRVHYTGWNTRYDEWIKPQRIAVNVTQHERSHGKKVTFIVWISYTKLMLVDSEVGNSVST